jgi:LCP family protein required for cell wall assembly
MDQPVKINSEGCRILALALLASLVITFCSVMGVACGYFLYEGLDIPYLHNLDRYLVRSVEASSLVPCVGPRFENASLGRATLPDIQLGRRVNILLLGLDQRGQAEHRAFRTDTIMIASLNPNTKEGLLFSIPRDLGVDVPGYGQRRINVVHATGEMQAYPGGGPALLRDTVERDFGIPIDGYVMVNFEGFREVVDLLGGVDIYVEKEICDNMYPNDRGGRMTMYIPAGQQHMDSEMLLRYCRSRYTTDDFDRAARQQKALVALGQKSLSLQMLPRLPGLLQTMRDAFDSDLTPEEMLRLALMASQVYPERVRSVVIDRSLLDPSQRQPGDEPDLLYPDWGKIHALVDEIFHQ